MPDEIERAIGLAERDAEIKVVVLRGARPDALSFIDTAAHEGVRAAVERREIDSGGAVDAPACPLDGLPGRREG